VWCVTASLQIDYLKPTPLDAAVVLRARVEAVEGHRSTIACVLSAGGVDRVRAKVLAVRVPLGWRAPA
jgi:acyl-CoA thioesterase FadM